MKKFYLIPILFFSAFSARATEVATIVDQLQKSYDSIRTISTDFHQTYRSLRFDPKEMKGKLVIQKPGKMRWDYETPKGRVLVADGKWITLYDPEDRQALVAEQPRDNGLPVAISFLLGRGKLQEKFHIVLSKDLRKKNGEVILQCEPIEPEPNVSEIYLTVKVGNPMLITSTLIIDALGGENEMQFSQIKVNPSVSKKKFEFTPPKGTPIVSMSAIQSKI